MSWFPVNIVLVILLVCFWTGYGSSPRSTSVGTAKGRISFLEQVFKELGLQKPILISSSMSGRYSIPFLFSSGERLRGFVSIAPVGTKDFSAQQYQQLEVRDLWTGKTNYSHLHGRWHLSSQRGKKKSLSESSGSSILKAHDFRKTHMFISSKYSSFDLI